jgi:hypothetical protein
MDARAQHRQSWAPMMPPRSPLEVEKLSDHGGQYVVHLACKCGHTRQARPETLAALSGWDCKLDVVVKRLRCSKCGKRQCTATIRHELKRDNRG